MYDKIVTIRMEREGVHSGELHAALIWNDIADLDLHVVTPSGEHIYYGHKESKCGGWLDVDMNVSNPSLEPIENIFWASSPSGHYKFYVNNFKNHTNNNTVFTDENRKVPFRVRLKRGDTIEWFEGSAGPKENVTCFEFDHQGSGAIGSFVVIPPETENTTFKKMCEKNKVTYTVGSGYYEVIKAEKISPNKEIVLYNKENDTFIITGSECREILKIPTDQTISLKKSSIPKKYLVFVQSTSHNRVIKPGVHSLIKVSVKEALKHRMNDKYQF